MGKVIGLNRGCCEQTVVIWRDGALQGWTWRNTVRTAAAVLSRWSDPQGRRWLRVRDTWACTFLVGEQAEGWVAMPWPPGCHGLPATLPAKPTGPARTSRTRSRGRAVREGRTAWN